MPFLGARYREHTSKADHHKHLLQFVSRMKAYIGAAVAVCTI
jgi:hypothetical protein